MNVHFGSEIPVYFGVEYAVGLKKRYFKIHELKNSPKNAQTSLFTPDGSGILFGYWWFITNFCFQKIQLQL